MLMSFEKYIDDNYERTRAIENLIAHPSVFELICLLPLSKKADFAEEPFSLDDCFI